jgi:hypothetical protein
MGNVVGMSKNALGSYKPYWLTGRQCRRGPRGHFCRQQCRVLAPGAFLEMVVGMGSCGINWYDLVANGTLLALPWCHTS